jgi:hypothetical protein
MFARLFIALCLFASIGCTPAPRVSFSAAPTELPEGAPLRLEVSATRAPDAATLLLGDETIPLARPGGTINPPLGERFTIETYAPAAPLAGREVEVTLQLTYADGARTSTSTRLRITNIGRVRAFAVGWHLKPSAGASQEAFRQEMERLVAAMHPDFAQDRPNLLVFPEHCALVTLLSGTRGAAARQKTQLLDALASLLDGYANAVADAQTRLGGGLASSLLLATSDTVWRTVLETFGTIARREHVFIAVGADVPDVTETNDPRLVAAYGDPEHPERTTAYVPVVEPDGRGRPYNQTLLFGPDGRLIGRTHKVNLVPLEQQFEFAPGRLEDVRVFDTPAGRLGIAISLDAFTDSYVRRIADQGAQIVVQNDANDGPWAGPGGRGLWQPLEWVDSILGSLAPRYAPLRYDVCPMMVGNLFDLQFDGQTTITASDPGKPLRNLLALDDQPHTGRYLFLGPWAFPDPGETDPSLTLDERRQRLTDLARTLGQGGSNEDQYPETLGWADLELE